MFGWLRKASQERVLKTMDALSYLANLTTAYKIESLLKEQHSDKNESEIGKILAFRTNYLFGRQVSESHAHIDAESEINSANIWLSNDSLFRELVVQSLRVMNTSKIAKGGDAVIAGGEILKLHGSSFPEGPTPEYYKELVFKAIESLTSNARIDILQSAEKLGLA